jgi:hypothetical protein
MVLDEKDTFYWTYVQALYIHCHQTRSLVDANEKDVI